MENEGDDDTNCDWSARSNPQRIGKRIGRFRNQRTNGDYSDYSNIKISQNTEKSPGNLMRLVVTQTPVKDHQLTLV